MSRPGEPADRDVRFTRERRLVRKRDFQRVFRKPRRVSDRYFTLLARAPEVPARARLGLAVSRRNARRAVDRNRIKRLVRESFRLSADPPAVDIVVIAKAPATRADRATLRASLAAHWRQLHRRFSEQHSQDNG